ncbi:MAG: hypothetical protein ACE37F_29520 [Nannocystaceae bacterium]|nr:hypothetical protein [bacterium]
MTQMDAMADFSRRYEPAVRGGCGLFNLVVSGKANFSPEFRARAAKVTADPTRFRRFRAHVILLDGLRALTVQMFINTVARVSNPPAPTTAVRSIDESAQWAAPHLRDAGWTTEALHDLQARVLEAQPQ